jgi:anaerobic ribonucleoside-triphosphate reductase
MTTEPLTCPPDCDTQHDGTCDNCSDCDSGDCAEHGTVGLPAVCSARSPNGRKCGSLADHVRLDRNHTAWAAGRVAEVWA